MRFVRINERGKPRADGGHIAGARAKDRLQRVVAEIRMHHCALGCNEREISIEIR